jgi:hypothetical protein
MLLTSFRIKSYNGNLAMRANIGSTDKIIRVIIGVSIIFTALYFGSWLAMLGFVPLITAAFRWSPLYTMFGVNTCPHTIRKSYFYNHLRHKIRT